MKGVRREGAFLVTINTKKGKSGRRKMGEKQRI